MFLRPESITVTGDDPTPDGYHDHMLYQGTSWWAALRATRDGLANDMNVVVRLFYGP